MRAVSKTLLRVINSEGFDPIELLDVKLTGQNPANSLHFTNAGQTITWNSNTYYPVSMSRGSLDEKLASSSGEIPSISMVVNNVDRQMAAMLAMAEVDGADATLWLADKRLLSNPRDAVRLAFGQMRDLGLSDTELTFSIVSILGMAERTQVPRRVCQSHCNYIFGEPAACGVDIKASPIRLTTTVAAGSTSKVLVLQSSLLSAAGSPADPNDFWSGGYVMMKNGQVGLQARPIQRVEVVAGVPYFWLRRPFMNAQVPSVGDEVLVQRICRKTVPDCQAYQGNVLQYGGFRDVPPVLFKPTEVDGGDPANAQKEPPAPPPVLVPGVMPPFP